MPTFITPHRTLDESVQMFALESLKATQLHRPIQKKKKEEGYANTSF